MHLGQFRIERQSSIVTRERLGRSPEFYEDAPSTVMGFNQIRLQAQRAIVAGKRLSMALEIEEGIGPARVGFGKIGLEGEGAIVAGKGLGSNWVDRSTNRPTEYNTPDDKYARVICDELLPVLYKEYNISKDPEQHGIGGASSGAIATHVRKRLPLLYIGV